MRFQSLRMKKQLTKRICGDKSERNQELTKSQWNQELTGVAWKQQIQK